VIDITLPARVEFERPSGGAQAIAEAARLLSEAKFPVILSGAGVVIGGAIPECAALAERLSAPVCNNYQHNDSFPGSHPLAVGPLGYNGSKAAMQLIAQADVVLALGTRLNPFSTLPCYGIDYWPRSAAVIQVDINADRIGLTKPVTVAICGDAKQVARQILDRLAPHAGEAQREARTALIAKTMGAWRETWAAWTMRMTTRAPIGTPRRGAAMPTGCRPARRGGDRGSPAARCHHLQRHWQQLRHRQCLSNLRTGPQIPRSRSVRPLWIRVPSIIGAKIGNPGTPVVGFAGDGAFGISMNEMSSIGREEWPGITMVIFRNYQWGAEKRNSILWYDNNFVGTELDPNLSYARVAEGCGHKGISVRTASELTAALREACDAQKRRVTTFIEVVLNQELGEPSGAMR